MTMTMTMSAAPPGRARHGAVTPLGLWPILIAMPLMYWPKILDGDTQPWVVAGAALSALFYWPEVRKPRVTKFFLPVAAALCCGAAYGLRETDSQLLIRYIGILATFLLLWAVAVRGGQDRIATAVRWSVAIWFLVGVYQVVALRLGLPLEFFGRYIASRSGVPGLTAEPSFYGSISVIQLMYLVTDQNRVNRPFIVLATISVLLSGSLLSYLLLLVPLMRMRGSLIVGSAILLLIVTTQGLRLSDTGLFNRIAELNILSALTDPMQIVQRDASTNLRFGHILFSLYDNLWDSLLFISPVSYRDAYNNWAFQDGRYIYNNSEYILTSAGELLFRSGAFGLGMIALIYYFVVKSTTTTSVRYEKIVFVTLCFLSPINLANPFFVFYIAQEERE